MPTDYTRPSRSNLHFKCMAVGVLFLAVLNADISLLPIWAAAICISGMTRLPVTSSTTPLNSGASKTWVQPLEFCSIYTAVLSAEIVLL